MSLADYQKLELSHHGLLAQALFSLADREAVSGPLSLSSEHSAEDAWPPFLTPSMQTWYLTNISTERGKALHSVRESFSGIDLGQGQRGFLLEAERDRIERTKFKDIKQERERFFAMKSVQNLQDQVSRETESYEQIKADKNAGEDANEWPSGRYFLVLFILFLPELPLNLEGFMSWLATVPIIAFVISFLVGAGILFSAHVVGTTAKQWSELFGADVRRRSKTRAATIFALALLIFVLAMTMVYLARSSLFRAAIERKMLLGETITFTDYLGIIVSVGGNLLVWLLGVGAAFLAHSHVPGFGAKQKTVQRLQKQLSIIYQKELQSRVDRALGHAQKELTNFEQLEQRRLKNRPDYIAARGQFEELRKIDNGVLGILDAYRGALLDGARVSGEALKFKIENLNKIGENAVDELDPQGYQRLKLRLPYA